MNNFIGIPFEEKDCFQLAREVYKKIHNYDMLQTEVKHYESEKIAKAFMSESSKWYKVTPQKGVIVAIRYCPMHPKLVTHFGVMIDDNRMIHTTAKTGSIIENISNYKHIIEGFYRHYN